MKEYTILVSRRNRTSEFTGTVAELVDKFRYTLEKGKNRERERGNKKINMNPKSISSLISNLNNAESNAAANGFSSTYYSLKA